MTYHEPEEKCPECHDYDRFEDLPDGHRRCMACGYQDGNIDEDRRRLLGDDE